ncbi:MAG: RNA polymerase sigma factor [Bianqueaceae bacterium]
MAELTREDFSAALAEIYTSLLDYAAKQLPDPSLTQDAVHDAIVYAYQNWNSDRCDLPAIQGWILNILQNRIRFLTRQYFQESKEIIHLHELPLCPWISSEDQLVQKERLQKLNAAFKAMDHRYARVVYLHYFRSMPFREIASVMDANLNTILTWHTKGKAFLLRWLKKTVNSQSKSHRGNRDGVTMRNVVEISLGKLKKRQK